MKYILRIIQVGAVMMILPMLFLQPCFAAVDTGVLGDALPPDASDTLEGLAPEEADLEHGLKGLWNRIKTEAGKYFRQALSIGLLMTGGCVLLALALGFTGEAGLTLPEKLPDFTAVSVLLMIYFSTSSSLINECTRAITQLDHFIKALTPVYVAVSATAGRPVSAVAVGEITLLFSAVILWACRAVILPGVSIYVLMDSIGGLVPTGLLGKLAELLRWAVNKSMKWILTGFTAYQTMSGIITRSTDVFAVKTAQTAISSMIPVVGNLISGTSDTILGGANLLRTSIGIYGFLAVCAICLGPLVRATIHFLVFKVLSACGSAYLSGAASRTITCITDAYGMAIGALGMCCLIEFIAIVVSTVVTAS